MTRVAIVGGGAAGCFLAALLSGATTPSRDIEVTVFEAGAGLMRKLAVTGGGRCNLTNTFEDVSDLSRVYPRGHRLMRRLLSEFGPEDVCAWFEARSVQLKVEAGGRVFPVSDDAMQIVRTLRDAMAAGGVRILCNHPVSSLDELSDYDAVVVTTGGFNLSSSGLLSPGEHPAPPEAKISPLRESLLRRGGSPHDGAPSVEFVPPVPSLFAFKVKDKGLNDLSGVSLENVSAMLKVGGKRFNAEGPMVLTHRGLSGPAILRLSSYAARELSEAGYQAELHIDFCGQGQDAALSEIESIAAANGSKLVSNAYPEAIPSRLWEHLAATAGLRPEARWAELAPKSLRRLAQTVSDYSCAVTGKSPYGEEFVTCGGVALSEVDSNTLECKKIPGLYFAGEVLDIDAITGGFNLQAAWSTAHAVFRSLI